METRAVYAAVLAKRLIEKGFIVRDIMPNDKNSQRTVFMFDDSYEVGKVIDEYTRSRK